MQTLRKDNQVNETVKQILIRSVGLTLATAFGGTAIGAVAGDWFFGTVVGVLSAFAVVLTTIGVSVAWRGTLDIADIQNAFRIAVAKSDSEGVRDALSVTEDGDFDFDDIANYNDIDTDLADPNVRPE